MTKVLKAGFLYFLGVFAMGFFLGAIRIFFLLAYTGPVIAVLIEIPIMLVFAWYLCLWLTEKLEIPCDMNARLLMGLVAFACLMTGEALLAILLQEGRVTNFFLTFDLPENRIALGGQIAFALFPVIQAYGRPTPQ